MVQGKAQRPSMLLYTITIVCKSISELCILDGYSIESTVHVLNGCSKLKNNYLKRHDCIVEKIDSKIKSPENKVVVNKTVQTALRESGLQVEDNGELLLNLKPDIVIKQENKLILDIACPYDLYLTELYEVKLNKYRDLQRYLTMNYLECEVDAIIVGSLGTIHKKALKVLMNTGMPKSKAKGLLKWSSTSSIIGSRQIWNLRCKLVKGN